MILLEIREGDGPKIFRAPFQEGYDNTEQRDITPSYTEYESNKGIKQQEDATSQFENAQTQRSGNTARVTYPIRSSLLTQGTEDQPTTLRPHDV